MRSQLRLSTNNLLPLYKNPFPIGNHLLWELCHLHFPPHPPPPPASCYLPQSVHTPGRPAAFSSCMQRMFCSLTQLGLIILISLCQHFEIMSVTLISILENKQHFCDEYSWCSVSFGARYRTHFHRDLISQVS